MVLLVLHAQLFQQLHGLGLRYAGGTRTTGYGPEQGLRASHRALHSAALDTTMATADVLQPIPQSASKQVKQRRALIVDAAVSQRTEAARGRGTPARYYEAVHQCGGRP